MLIYARYKPLFAGADIPVLRLITQLVREKITTKNEGIIIHELLQRRKVHITVMIRSRSGLSGRF